MESLVTLRPIEQVDPAVILAAVNESYRELAPWMPWCTPEFGIADVTRFQQGAASDRSEGLGYAFGIFDADELYCGTCGINAVNVNRYANLGYWVRTSRTGSGLATAAVRELAAWVFQHTDLYRLEIVMAEGNLASQRVAARAGAVREAVLRQRVLLPSGQADAVMYRLLREEVTS